MSKNQKLVNFILPVKLHTAAQETARRECKTVSAVLRRYLEAYTATQPTKQAA